jgi:hypothetical protein
VPVCGKEREDVKFGDDTYYREIITNDFDKIRDAWKEGGVCSDGVLPWCYDVLL